jgi:hypothetical protein
MIIVLPNSIFRFEFNSSELSQQNRELLSRIAGILLVSKGYGLSVFGYTDDVGTAEYNQQLSLSGPRQFRTISFIRGSIPRSSISKAMARPVPSSRARARRAERRTAGWKLP